MKKDSMPSDKKVLEQALERFKLCEENERHIRKKAKEDLRFLAGEQWPADVLEIRKRNGRPSLVINKMPQHTRHITNDQKQNRPAIKVSPVDDQADVDTANVLKGLIRNIEHTSDAEEAYDKAFEYAVKASFGFWRVYTDYEHDQSFNLEPRIGMIDNPFNVYLDPYSVKVDGSDANYGFIIDKISKDEFLSEHSDSDLKNHSDWKLLAKEYEDGWLSDDSLRVCEYYFKEQQKVKLLLLSDGSSYFEDEVLKDEEDENVVIVADQMLTIEDERDAVRCKIYWYKINAVEVLDKTEWVGSYIPIIPVYGETLNVDGEVIRESAIRHAKDSQRMVNYWASSEAEAITLAPKAPFIGAEGSFEGHEADWQRANTDNLPFLEYKPTLLDNGSPAPPPQRNAFEPPVMAITQARQLANEDVKETTGVPDAARGLASPETSGIAIQRRVNQGLTSNFHFVDNLNKSIKHTGRILVEIIPKLYDTPRVVRILGEQGEEELIKINSVVGELPEGQKRPYDFTYGKYDVTVSTGPNYETKRQEARDSMLQMSQANPQFAQVASDLMVKNMDWPGADEIAERLKRTIPPEIIGGNDEMPPQAVAQIKQMQQMIEQLTQQLQEAQNQIEKDLIKIESQERIKAMEIDADLKKELMKIDGKEGEIILKEQMDLLNKRLEMLDYNEPIES
jgi:hypothetical protein